jgi:hypothetical protein
MLAIIFALVCFGVVTLSQLPPQPEEITVLRSKFHENVTISYKEVRDQIDPLLARKKTAWLYATNLGT